NRQVELGGDDESGIAPLGLPDWIGAAIHATEVAGEKEALLLRRIGVVIAEIKREHAVGKGHTEVPGPIVRQLEGRDANELVGGPETLVTDLTGNVPAAFSRRRQGREVEGAHRQLRSARCVEAIGAAAEPIRRVVEVRAECELILDGIPGDLAIDLPVVSVV